MKLLKNFIIILSVFASIQLVAQEEEKANVNNFYIGGNFHYSNSKNTGSYFFPDYIFISQNEQKHTSFSINPYVVRDLNQNWQLGVALNYTFNKSVYSNNLSIQNKELKSVSNRFGASVFTRYIIRPEQRFNFYLEPGFGLSSYNQEQFSDDESISDNKSLSFIAHLGVGIRYAIAENWILSLSTGGLSFTTGSWENTTTETKNFNRFDANFRLSSISFGFEYKL